jgi:hypothetical protein
MQKFLQEPNCHDERWPWLNISTDFMEKITTKSTEIRNSAFFCILFFHLLASCQQYWWDEGCKTTQSDL